MEHSNSASPKDKAFSDNSQSIDMLSMSFQSLDPSRDEMSITPQQDIFKKKTTDDIIISLSDSDTSCLDDCSFGLSSSRSNVLPCQSSIKQNFITACDNSSIPTTNITISTKQSTTQSLSSESYSLRSRKLSIKYNEPDLSFEDEMDSTSSEFDDESFDGILGKLYIYK